MTGIVAQFKEFKDWPTLRQFLLRWGVPFVMALLAVSDVVKGRTSWQTYAFAFFAVLSAYQTRKSKL